MKNAVEQSYQCLGITCIEVGGLWDTNNGTGAYRTSASPCVDSQQSQVGVTRATPSTVLVLVVVLLLLLLYYHHHHHHYHHSDVHRGLHAYRWLLARR